MKRQIRRNVFETNSSSMHSLTVMKRDEHYSPEEFLDGFYLGDDGIWSPWDDDLEFGRSPFRALGNFHDKWLYACASLVDEYNDDTYNEEIGLFLASNRLFIKILQDMVNSEIRQMKYDVVDELFRNVAKASAKLGVKFV